MRMSEKQKGMVQGGLLSIMMVVVVLLVGLFTWFVPQMNIIMIQNSSDAASDYLTGRGYIVLAAEEYGDLLVDVAAIKSKTDKLPDAPMDEIVNAIADTRGSTVVLQVDYWGDIVPVITLGSVATDINLPDIDLDILPLGLEVKHAHLMFAPRVIEYANGNLQSNAIDGTQYITIKEQSDTWSSALNGLLLPDGLYEIQKNAEQNGGVFVSSLDVHSLLNGNGTYNLRFENGKVDANYLVFRDVQVGMRLHF